MRKKLLFFFISLYAFSIHAQQLYFPDAEWQIKKPEDRLCEVSGLRRFKQTVSKLFHYLYCQRQDAYNFKVWRL